MQRRLVFVGLFRYICLTIFASRRLLCTASETIVHLQIEEVQLRFAICADRKNLSIARDPVCELGVIRCTHMHGQASPDKASLQAGAPERFTSRLIPVFDADA